VDQPEPRPPRPADEPGGTLASPAHAGGEGQPAWGEDKPGWGEGQPGWAATTPERASPRAADRRPAARHGAAAGPGLAQHLPAGLRDWLGGTPRWVLATLAGLLIVAAGLLAGLAFAGGGGSAGAAAGHPASGGAASYRTYTVAGTATTAGYSLQLPAGWQGSRHGRSTYFVNPGRTVSVVVYPVPADATALLSEARILRQTVVKQHTFPGFQGLPTALHPVHLASGSGVSWTFAWRPADGRRRDVVETLLHPLGTPLLRRFVIQEIAPTATFHSAEPAFAAALRTFRIQP